MSTVPCGDATDWNARWEAGDTPWDLGAAHPVLPQVLAEDGTDRWRVLVPGAGAGHDALAWAAAGHEVVAADIAPAALERLAENARAQGVQVRTARVDITAPPASWAGTFDRVWEHTCFCAIDPSLRDAYAAAVTQLLRPGGRWNGVLWENEREDGPPWDIPIAVARHHLIPPLAEVRVDPHIPQARERSGEYLLVATRP